MRPAWDDLVARVRGLQAHFLDAATLGTRRHAAGLDALAAALRSDGIVSGELPEPVRPVDLELAIRRWAAGILRVVARWAGPRSDALPYLFDDEDRRSIRAMLRGAIARIPAEDRLRALIPTPALPERALQVLAGAASPSEIGRHLVAWRHPFGPDLADATVGAEPDPFHLELTLARCVAQRALASARRSGDALLRRHVSDTIDLQNAITALVLLRHGHDVVPRDHFLDGGRALTIARYEEAIASGSTAAALQRLTGALDGVACAGVLAESPDQLEDRLLACRIDALGRSALMQPLGPIVLVRFTLLLRQQVIALRRAVWTVALVAAPGGAAVAVR